VAPVSAFTGVGLREFSGGFALAIFSPGQRG